MSVQELQQIISPKFTEQVLIDIVQKNDGLSDVKVDKIIMGAESKKGDSYLSNICRFTLEATGKNSGGQEEKVSIPVIVKYLLKNVARRKTFRSADFFENEVIFYDKVWSLFQEFQDYNNIPDKFDNVPKILSACTDGSNDYIAMLDVSSEGYKSADRGTGLNYELSAEILKLLARFHALSLAIKDQQPEAFEKAATSLKETYFAEKHRKWYGRFQANLFEILRDAVQKELPPEYLEKVDKLISGDLYQVLCKLCELRGPLSVVTHGDVWAPNFMLKHESSGTTGKIMMIDFQLTRYTTLANDITFFFYSCVDDTLWEEKWDDLVGVYHKALSDSLEKFGSDRDLVTLESLHNELKVTNAFGIGMGLEAIVMSLLDDDEVSDLDAIQGEEAVPLESVWLVHPLKEKNKRQRLAHMIKFAVDKNFI